VTFWQYISTKFLNVRSNYYGIIYHCLINKKKAIGIDIAIKNITVPRDLFEELSI